MSESENIFRGEEVGSLFLDLSATEKAIRKFSKTHKNLCSE